MMQPVVHARRTVMIPWLVLLLLAWLARPAQAYRPFDLTDADVAKRHQFEFELGLAELGEGSAGHSFSAPTVVINFGLARGRELGFEGTNRVALHSVEGEPRMQLAGKAIALKQMVRRGTLQDESGPSIAVGGEIEMPDRDEEHLGATAALIVSSSSHLGVAHFNVEAGREATGHNAGAVGLIFEQGDESGLDPAVELRVAAVKGGLPEESAIVGLIYVPGDVTEYDFALRFARSGDERTFEIRAGLTIPMSLRSVVKKAKASMGIHPSRRRRH